MTQEERARLHEAILNYARRRVGDWQRDETSVPLFGWKQIEVLARSRSDSPDDVLLRPANGLDSVLIMQSPGTFLTVLRRNLEVAEKKLVVGNFHAFLWELAHDRFVQKDDIAPPFFYFTRKRY